MNTRLVLIDGTAVAYRAYFAIRDLSTKSGRPTNAVFGFVRMVEQLRTNWKPTHWVVAFDGGLPEERTRLLEDYKAQRPPMPKSLRDQLETIDEYLDLAGVPWSLQEGQEADDVMASLAHWAGKKADTVLVATGDKDMYQIVDERTRVVSLSGKATAMGPEEVRGKTGVEPSQMVDWLALVGDNSDNIPGVPGVGPKTAASLLECYGSLKGLLKNVATVESSKVRKALTENKDTALRNLEMICLRRDLDSPFRWEELKSRPPSPDRLIPFFEELEFHSMVRALREQDMFR